MGKKTASKPAQRKSLWPMIAATVAIGASTVAAGYFTSRTAKVAESAQAIAGQIENADPLALPAGAAYYGSPVEGRIHLSQRASVEKLAFSRGYTGVQITKLVKREWGVLHDHDGPSKAEIAEHRQHVREFFAWLGTPRLLEPELDYVVPKDINEVSIFGVPTVFFLKNFGEKCTVFYRGLPSGQAEECSFVARGIIGQTLVSYEVNGTALNVKRGNVMYRTPPTRVDELQTIPCETLHYAMLERSVQHLAARWKSEYVDSAQDAANLRRLNELQGEIHRVDEGLVHSLALCWLLENHEKYRIMQEQIHAKLAEFETMPDYRQVKPTLEKIQTHGAQKTLEDYLTKPMEIYGR